MADLLTLLTLDFSAVHMPISLFAAATIYGAFSFAGQANVRLPAVVSWKDVVVSGHDKQDKQSDSVQWVQHKWLAPGHSQIAPKNVLYELNSVQKLFRGLATQWGVSADMGKVIGQWIALCQSGLL